MDLEKSTFVNILMGFYEDYKGSIFVDNNLLNEKNLKNWQSKISYVPQKLFLFDDTIKNNITLGQDISYFDENKFKKATMISTVNDFVEKLDQKYDTLVKDEGTRFFWWTNSKNKFSKSNIFFQRNINFR